MATGLWPGYKRLGSLMELKEYISIRRSYNLVRQETPSDQRLTFEEFAILCKLGDGGAPLKTSEIAAYQGSLRPTMTHRTNHLAHLGLIERHEGSLDSRNVVCSISQKGGTYLGTLVSLVSEHIPSGQPLSRTSPERLAMYVEAMGTVFFKAGDLVLLALHLSNGGTTISGLVKMLGLLQPTVSMSVTSLEAAGLVERSTMANGAANTFLVSLTHNGDAAAEDLLTRVHGIIVRRKPRTNA